MQIGFIGLGHMGQHMARHVAEAGHSVAAFDLRSEAIAELTSQSPNSSTFQGHLSTLRNLDFIRYPAKRVVTASPVLFLEA